MQISAKPLQLAALLLTAYKTSRRYRRRPPTDTCSPKNRGPDPKVCMTSIWRRCGKFRCITSYVSKQETTFTVAGLRAQTGTVGSPLRQLGFFVYWPVVLELLPVLRGPQSTSHVQNYVILLIFRMWKIRDRRYVWNLLLSTSCEFITMTSVRQTQPQTSKNRLTAPPSVAARPAILSSRDRSIAGYS